ncbi:MAG TPA: hypothetical protein VHN99_05460 [Deinococcales bacterium]|nr:hypothetical protein [Deinococcales bacterium]
MGVDRLREALKRLTNDPRVDYLALYPAKVLKDRGGNAVDVQPTDERLPMLSNVPLRLGIPGVMVSVQPGALVLVGFDGASPEHPYAALFQAGSLSGLTITCSGDVTVKATGSVKIGAGPIYKNVALVGDAVSTTGSATAQAGTITGTGTSKVQVSLT